MQFKSVREYSQSPAETLNEQIHRISTWKSKYTQESTTARIAIAQA